MTYDELNISARIEKERKRIFNKSRKCFHPFSEKTAIDSHVLQKNGFISIIAEEGHVIEYDYYPFNDKYFHFKKTGINKVFTFKGFYSHHDDFLFKEIEKPTIDFNDYKTMLTFGYRILTQEIIKKLNNIELYESLVNKNIIEIENIQENIYGQMLGIKDARFTLNKIYKNIENSALKDFNFHSRIIKYLSVCASGIYTFETTKEQNEMSAEVFALPLTDIFVNILPYKGNTIVSFGYLNSNNLSCNSYIINKFNLPEVEFIKFLSDILVGQMENWILSPTQYDIIKEDEDIIFDLTNKAFELENERFHIDYNLFK